MTCRLFAGLADSLPDPILSQMEACRRDLRPDKLDLTVGVYRDGAGRTPVMRAVAAAERKLLQEQETKSYVALAGDRHFLRALGALALGASAEPARLAQIATPGGTGAVRQALELLRTVRAPSTLWLPDPSWANHAAIAQAVGIPTRCYRHAMPSGADIDGTALLDDLSRVQPGDVIVLHGCCHNPTGLDLSADLWRAVGAICLQRGAVPLVDLAYQGLGSGLEADAQGLRHLTTTLPEVMVAQSGSKTFGLYRERVGLLSVLCAAPAEARVLQGRLESLNRLNYTFPPDHGARVAQIVLDTPGLRADWQAELDTMRARLEGLRRNLADALEAEGVSGGAGVRRGKGIFTRLAFGPETARQVAETRAIYMIADGRINISGMRDGDAVRVARALREASGTRAT